MYGYIYKTTNKINNKIYIGQKHSSKFLGNSYLGSGKRLKDSIKHYGKEAFIVELIEEVESKELMDLREIYWISFYNSTDPSIGYNISTGGNVNRTMVGENNPFYGKHHSDKSREKMSKHNARPMLGKHHSEETKQKIRNKNSGKSVSESTRQKLSDNAKTNPNYGMKGKIVSEHTKKLLSLSKLGKPSKAKGKIHITNFIEDKMIYPEEFEVYEKLGYVKGRKKFTEDAKKHIKEGHKGIKPSNKGKIWINNGEVEKFIPECELDYYINIGWIKGRVK